MQALPQFSSLSGIDVSERGLIVLVLQYGTGKIDFLGKDRAYFDWTSGWKSHFLHPVFYYYDKLPTGEDKCGCDQNVDELLCLFSRVLSLCPVERI